MVDLFSLALTHALLALAAWRLLLRDDLDRDPEPGPRADVAPAPSDGALPAPPEGTVPRLARLTPGTRDHA